MSSVRLRSRLAILAVLGLVLLGGVAPASAQWPPEVKNLQHFPKDMEFRELMPVMRSFAFGLGVRCQFCHVGEEGQPLATFDFASDEKDNKKKARVMLAMVDAINGEHLAKLEGDSERVRVECVTCHRGAAHPEQLRDILVAAAGESPDAAVARYRELREEFYGQGTYNFSESTLMQAAEALAEAGQMDAAVALVDESLAHTPESAWALGTLAGLEQRRGNVDAAVAALKRILDFDPDNERVRQQLDKLTAPAEEGGDGS